MSSTILEFQNISFSRGPRLLLDRMSFSIEKQEMVALLGPNGVGKTTMLKIATRLLQPSSGTVLMQGRPLEAWSRRELPRAVALVPQELEIPFNFRVEEIVAQGRVPYLPLFEPAPHWIMKRYKARWKRWISSGSVIASIPRSPAANVNE